MVCEVRDKGSFFKVFWNENDCRSLFPVLCPLCLFILNLYTLRVSDFMTGMCFSDPDHELFLCTHLLDLYRTERYPHMPTFPDYLEVSRIWHWSPALPYRSPNLPGKMDFRAFLHSSLQFSPFFSQNSNFFYSLYSFWDIFAHIYSLRKIMFSFIQWRKRILIACTSCKTS